MAVQTGTATDWKDLLADLVTFVTANGWVEEDGGTGAGAEDPDFTYLRGPGSSGNADVHVNIRTGATVAAGAYWWEVRGALTFDSSLTFENQPGVSPPTYLLLWENSIDYWFYVTDRRIIVVAKVSTSYLSIYAGFFLPFATPTEYPFPLYVGSSAAVKVIYTAASSAIRSFADPGEGAAWLREPGGAWVEVSNHGDDTTSDDDFEAHALTGYYLWPYWNGTGTLDTMANETLARLEFRPAPGAPSSRFLLPLHLFGTAIDAGVIGVLEGAFWTFGFGAGSEQSFNIGTAHATETLTATGNFSDGETVVIDGKTYAFQATLTDSDGNVLVGADADESLDNLVAAIQLGDGAGTVYAASTTVHPTVAAARGAGDTLDATAKAAGADGNSIAVSETAANASWGAGTLSGGVDGDDYRIFQNVRRAGKNHFFAVQEA